MSIEIERKFLVKNLDFKKESFDKKYIKQGYLNSDKNRAVRIRITDNKAYLTIKGKSNLEGTTRFEWEKQIDLKEAESLFLLCEPGIIEKHRYLVSYQSLIFEVDEFNGDNKGLIIAEVELTSENQKIEKPNWLGKEVTGDVKYYNSNISKFPFKNWV
ncbi:CYTH domain-containing protein [uncultured Polaribacter sp.]|uniref:CYTH domain-containing protein n=1 Tax=uncultured Polaribacter sp. TaxID=174711 RepID=UPI00263770E8|nr:CYTH domain-containing protein [uncultured Polaribacter sp.]